MEATNTAETGPDHDEHPEEADGERRPAPLADNFAEEHDGEYRAVERAGEHDRHGIGERDFPQCVEKPERGDGGRESP